MAEVEKKAWQPSRTDWQDPAAAGARVLPPPPAVQRAPADGLRVCVLCVCVCGTRGAGGKGVLRTAQDVEELTKNVNVEGKRDALLASSAAAEEATKV